MTATSRRLLLAALMTVTTAAALYVALASPPPGSASGAERVAGERAAAMREFAVLRRPAQPADHPSRAMEMFAGNAGVAPDASRRASLPLGAPDVRVLPRTDELCLLVEVHAGRGFAGYGCSPWDQARAGRLHLTLSGGPDQADGEAVVVGLVPDAADAVRLLGAGGGEEAIPTSQGFYFARVDGARGVAVDRDGDRAVVEFGSLPGRDE
jgi:hypothetical protein